MTPLKHLVLGWVFLLCSFSYSNAQEQTSGNLINNNNWSGATYGVDPGGCCASISGSGALYDTSTNTIMFSYALDTLVQTIGLQQALGGTGIQVSGYNYSFDYRHMPNNSLQTDYLSASIWLTTSTGFATEATHLNLNGMVGPGVNDQWNFVSGSRLFSTSYLDPQSITMRFEGRDGGFWGGYYGPEIRNVSLSVNYVSDPCASNPLYSVDCPGYQAAWELQQYNLACSADPLFDIGCPGFQQALESTVCSVLGPLASLFCPGYAEALAFQQACTADATYDPDCPGYGAAMAKKLEEQNKDEPTAEVVQSAPVVVVEDSTKSETNVDVGGVELSATGEISVPDDKPEVLKESVKEEEKEKKEVDRNLLMSIIRDATDNTEALKVVNQSIEQSLSEDANPNFTGTEEALQNIATSSLFSIEIAMSDSKQEENFFDETKEQEETKQSTQSSQTTFAEKEEKTEEVVKVTSFDTTNTTDLGNQVKVEIKEVKEEEKTVKKDVKDNDLATGASIDSLAKSPIDLTAYTNQALKDGQFYKSEEIYKNQFIGDNRRAQRLLNESNDRLYNDLTKDQYKEK
jgi:hypothetical protein